MKKQRNLQALMISLMALGSSMYGLFLPIFFLNNGVSFQRLIFYFIAYCLGGAFSSVIANILTHKFGIKFFIILRGIVEPILILIARFYPQLHYPIEIFGFVFGFIGFAFWITIDTMTVKYTDNNSRGNQQGFIYGALWSASIVAPFIGGFLIKQFSYPILFLVSLLLILIGGVVSLFLKMDVSIKKKFNLFPKLNSKITKHMMLVFIRGFSFSYVVWMFTLIIYELVHDEFLIGSYGLILGIISLIATIISGKLIDRMNKKYLMNAMIFLFSISFIILGLFFNYKYFYLFLFLTYFIYSMMNVPLNTLFFNDIEQLDVVTLVSERMITFTIGGALSLVLMFFLNYNIIFVVLGLLTLTSLFYSKEL